MSKKFKKEGDNPPLIRGTYHLSCSRGRTTEVRAKILRRRLQILVHSYLYYVRDINLVSDETWSSWAQELCSLQEAFPEIADRVDYAEAFRDFDPSTGYDLPYRNPEIVRKAEYLLRIEEEKKNGRKRRKGGKTP